MISLISIYIGGFLTIFMGIFHTQFPKLFKWKSEYKNNTDVNKRIFFTIHLALLLMFFVIGFLTLFFAQELCECVGLAFGLNLVISIFWLWRTIWQIVYFKGKLMHFVLIAYFFLLFIAYLIPIAIKLY